MDPVKFNPFLIPRHDEDLREPLVLRQGSQVSMRVARGLSGKESAQGCIPKRLLGRPDEALGGGNQGPTHTYRGRQNHMNKSLLYKRALVNLSL